MAAALLSAGTPIVANPSTSYVSGGRAVTEAQPLRDGGDPFRSVRVGVLGATERFGGEIIRLLADHPRFSITLLTAEKDAGHSMRSMFPHLLTEGLPTTISIEDANFSDLDSVFSCLPDGRAQEVIEGLPKHLKIVQLPLDVRVRDILECEKQYEKPHKTPMLQKAAVCGLPELFKPQIRKAQFVANPGCHATAVLLPLHPLLKIRGMLVRIEVRLPAGVTSEGLEEAIFSAYKREELTKLAEYLPPLQKDDANNFCYGTNHCFMHVSPSCAGKAQIHVAIDSLLKGACGQAIQNMNLMVGFPQNLGLQHRPLSNSQLQPWIPKD